MIGDIRQHLEAAPFEPDRLLRELNSRGDRESVLMLAGGPAAGKSSSLGENTIKDAGLVWDSILNDPTPEKLAGYAWIHNGCPPRRPIRSTSEMDDWIG